MPCLRCGVEFGLFKRESYCRNCGFAFCNGCLSKKTIIPKLGTESKHAVCKKCFVSLTSGQTEINSNNVKPPASPPAALQKRLELLSNKMGTNANGISKVVSLDKDKAITERLQRLQADSNAEPAPSVNQLEERLAQLKGVSVESVFTTPSTVVCNKPDSRTAFEQSQDLLSQMTEEALLDSKLPNPDEEIRLRLAKLRNEDPLLNDLNKPSASGGEHLLVPSSSGSCLIPPTLDSNATDPKILEVWQYMLETEKEVCREAEEALRLQEKDLELKRKLQEIKANRDTTKRHHSAKILNGDVSDEDNEDKITDKVIQQFLSESRLENNMPPRSNVTLVEKRADPKSGKEQKLINSSDNEDSELEELPWCTICNEDAFIRCYGCDGDLYCRRCFRQCHDTYELREHPSVPFRPN